jgi:phosphatidate phosphatase APP1
VVLITLVLTWFGCLVGTTRGQVHYTIISDVDDTIKKTEVLSKPKAILNTVLPFAPIPGMPEVYNAMQIKFQQAGGRVSWNYVSGSPSILMSRMEDFIKEFRFPHGSFYLQNRIDFWEHTKEHKITTISGLMDQNPNSVYIMIGDSTELDAEIYTKIYHDYASLGIVIRCILIRIAEGVNAEKEREKNSQERFKQSLFGVPQERRYTFRDPSELMHLLTPGGSTCY